MSGDNSEDNFVCLKNTEKLASKRSPNWNEDGKNESLTDNSRIT